MVQERQGPRGTFLLFGKHSLFIISVDKLFSLNSITSKFVNLNDLKIKRNILSM